MDIKEKFYANLEQLREAKKPSWEKEGNWSKQMKKQEKTAMKKLTPKAKAARDAAAEKQIDEEQLDEISGAKARKAEHASAEVYHRAYDDETRARRKAIKDKTPESKEAAEKAKEKREKAAKRTIRFQNYADKKK